MASCQVTVQACHKDDCEDSVLDLTTVVYSARVQLRDNGDQSAAGRSRFVDADTGDEFFGCDQVFSGNLDASGCWTTCLLAANSDILPLAGGSPSTYYAFRNRTLTMPTGEVKHLPDVNVVLDETATPLICGTTVDISAHIVAQPPAVASQLPPQLTSIDFVANVESIDAGVAQGVNDNGVAVTAPAAGTLESIYVFADTTALAADVTAELVVDGVATGDTLVLTAGLSSGVVRGPIIPTTTAIPATGGPHTYAVVLNGDGIAAELVADLKAQAFVRRV